MADLRHWSRDEIGRIRDSVDRLFDDLCRDLDLPLMTCRMNGDLDVREEKDELIIRLELGSIRPDEVRVAVSGDRLIISGAMDRPRSLRTFRRETTLPCPVREDLMEYRYEADVLEMRLPKKTG